MGSISSMRAASVPLQLLRTSCSSRPSACCSTSSDARGGDAAASAVTDLKTLGILQGMITCAATLAVLAAEEG